MNPLLCTTLTQTLMGSPVPLGHHEHQQRVCNTTPASLWASWAQRGDVPTGSDEHPPPSSLCQACLQEKIDTSKAANQELAPWWVTAEPCLSLGQEGISQLL